MAEKTNNYLAFVVYGNDKTYYDGVRFCILSFLAHWSGVASTRPNVIVLTEEIEHFKGLPVKVLSISPEQKSDWSLGGDYHFRIKNRGLKYICQEICLKENDKLLFLDTDTYFNQATNIYFDNISPESALMFFPEVNINSLPNTNEYACIRGKDIPLVDGTVYRVSESSTMWASAVIGMSGHSAQALDYADMLILALRNSGCFAHTLEQFALSEALSQNVELKPAKSWVNHYSTSGRKDWARKVLEKFFDEHGDKPFEDQIALAKNVSFKRPLSEVVRGHIYKKKKKFRALLGLKPE